MKFIFKHWVWLIALVSIALFWWLRFNFIRTAFDFTGDPGRDMLVLWDWKESGKPPLLGPQTSAMPINQSAVYFYMLYPAFLISNGNPVSANYTVAVFWIVSLIAGLWCLRKRTDLQWVILIVFALSAIHPIFVAQTRSVWNPSFLPPLITTGLIAVYLLKEKFTVTRMWIFGLSMSLSVSLHFPVGALAVASLMYLGIYRNDKWLRIFMAFVLGMLFFNLPTLVFELRHGFLLTKSTLAGHWLGTEQFTRMENLYRSVDFSGGLGVWWANLVFFVSLTLFGLKKVIKEKTSIGAMAVILLAVTLILTIASKMAFHSHYIYAFAILLFVIFSQLPTKLLLPALLVLEIIWLNPVQTNKYFTPARRSLEEMETCMRRVCETVKEPIYVSVQSGHSPFHVGYEYRYLLKKSGCEVKYIESQPGEAKKMALVLDGSDYEPGKTSFNELTLFGSATKSARYECGQSLGVIILSN